VAQGGQHSLVNTRRDRCSKGQLNRSAIECAEPQELGFSPKKGDINIDRGGEALIPMVAVHFCAPASKACYSPRHPY